MRKINTDKIRAKINEFKEKTKELNKTINIDSINNQIQMLKNSGGSAKDVSDGYHTFGDLYNHRYLLFLNLVKQNLEYAYKFKKNADGKKWKGSFGLGLFKEKGQQITYHLPDKYWDMIDCEEMDSMDFFDGHSSKDVEDRLYNLLIKL